MASDRHRDRKTGSHERRIEDRTWEREADERNSEERKSDRHVDAFWERDTNYREGSEPKKSRPEERERDQSIYSTGNDRVVHRGRPHGERSEIDSEGARRRNLRVGAEYVSRYEHDKETSGARRTFPNAEDNAFHRLEFESNPRRGRSGGEYSEIKHDEVKRRASRVDSGSKSQYDRSSENVTNKREALGEQDPVAYYGTSKIPDYRTKATHGERAGSVRRQRYPGREGHPISAQELNEEPPLPLPPPPRHPSKAPFDLPEDRSQPEYGRREEYEDGDVRLRAELYPLEETANEEKMTERERGARDNKKIVGSQSNSISPVPYGQPTHSRQGERQYQSSKPNSRQDYSGVRKFADRSDKDTYLYGNALQDAKKPVSSRSCSRKDDLFKSRSLHTGSRPSMKDTRNYIILKEEEEENFFERKRSVLLPVLEDSERVFHELVASGDVSATKMFLQNCPDFNINCVNYQKISALHVAVKQQNEDMVEFLLEQRGLDISDCGLYAIKGGNIRIVEMIFNKIRERYPRLEFAGSTHSVDFPDDLTPLILASQLGNYEMIDFLIKRGHSIPPVHPPFCKCEACKIELKKYDRLKYSTMKLNLYKAICNPMYIFHTTDDPFQRAFELTKELQDAATVFPQFKVSFQNLWLNLRRFTVDLIGCCRNAQEVEIILKKSPKCVADYVKFPRLQYAIDLKQKEFVSHPYTQAVLGDAWTGELLEWKIRSPLMQSLSVFPRIPMLPIMTIMCIFLPNHSLVRKWKTPVNKMISRVASYLIFLIILFLESNLDKRNQKRGPPNSGLEIVIIVYVIGYIWLNVRTCFKQGLKRFFSTMWHWYDTIMLILFSLTIVFWIASLVDITANNDVDLPRKYWNSLDPELIAEGLFAAAVIMAFFRLNLFLSLNYHLGPLQVSIGKMTLDIFKFIIIFFIIVLAWCAGLCRFYQPYEGMIQKDAASGSTTSQVSSFVSFPMTLKTFFWAIFGMSPIESADVVIENLPGDTSDTTIINKHQFTEAVGYIAFALFQFLSVVVVLNMLVACMANTFTKVIDNVTVEWVFGRSQIYLSFMASSILPPPFNLVPTASGIRDMFRWFRLLAKPSDGQRAKCSLTHCCYIENETEAYVSSEFPPLMSELAQRYIRRKAQAAAEEENVHDIDDLRSEINEIKEMLRKFNSANNCNRNSM